MKKYYLILSACITIRAFSQDIQGAYIFTNWISANTYSFNITLLADASVNIARPTLTLSFGDNSTGTFSLGNTVTVGNTNIKHYSGTHTYPGFGNYVVNFLGVYRVSGIRNMQASQMQSVGLSALINVSAATAANNAIAISNLPVNLSTVNNPFVYNPGCTTPSGDSLSYSLDYCTGAGYYKPNGSSVNNITGQFNFSNDTSGLYAFLLTIKQWRKNPSTDQYFQLASYQMDFTVDVTSTVGIREQIKSAELNIYPNPFADKLNLNLGQTVFRPCTITLINSLGQVVFAREQAVSEQEINLRFLPSGVYYLYISDGISLRKSVKVIKD